MNVDRSWMYDQWHALPRTGLKDKYVKGVDYFIQFASARVLSRKGIRCPCINCKNREFQDTVTVKLHLLNKGFMPYYQVWTTHGEKLPISPMNVEAETGPCQQSRDGHNRGDNPFVDMLFDIAGPSLNIPSDDIMQEDEPNEAAKKFFESMKLAEKPLCPGSEGDTVLSFTSKLFKLKSEHNASQALINGILDLMRPNLPKGHNLPDNVYSAKKLIEALGLPHERIDVCINGCMLFWKDDSELSECKVCRHARWKGRQKTTDRKATNVPYQRLHYLPLIPRLQRLFTSEKTANWIPTDHEPTKTIVNILLAKIDKFWPTYSKVPKDTRKQWFAEFKLRHHIKDEDIGRVRDMFDVTCARRFKDWIHKAKNIYFTTGEIPSYIHTDVHGEFKAWWGSPEFKKRSQTNKANRNRVNAQGRKVAKHTCGSRSIHDTKLVMKEMEEACPEMQQFLRRPEDVPREVLAKVDTTFIHTMGVVGRTRVPCLGNLSQEYILSTTSFSLPRVSDPRVEELTQHISHLTNENDQLKEQLSDMKQMWEEQRRIDAEREARRDQREAERDAQFRVLMDLVKGSHRQSS